MTDRLYKDALFAAYKELDDLKEKEKEIAIRKAKLKETVNALYPLVFPEALDINSLSLPNALRLVLRSAGRPLSAQEFRTKLQDIGFDIQKFENPMANILTAMNRMTDSDEMTWVENEKKAVVPGPELKQVPEAFEFPSGLGALGAEPLVGDSQKPVLDALSILRKKK